MPHDPHYIFGAAVIAICAMILPGISGSFMLVLMGQYQYIPIGCSKAFGERDGQALLYTPEWRGDSVRRITQVRLILCRIRKQRRLLTQFMGQCFYDILTMEA